MTATANVYEPISKLWTALAYLDGRQIHDVFAACPAEGWVDVFEHADGDNFTHATSVQLTKDKKNHPRGIVQKRLYGVVRVVGEDGEEYR